MAGPGIRAWHLADELSKHFAVTLIARLEGRPPEVAQFPLVARGSAVAACLPRSPGAAARGLGSRLILGMTTEAISTSVPSV